MRRRQKLSTRAKRKVAKITGIPTTKSGRKAKVRRMLLPGCALPIIAAISCILLLLSSI